MTDILAKIADYKRDEVARRRRDMSLDDIETRIQDVGAPRGFATALMVDKRPGSLSLIAEIKKASPSKGLIREDFNPPELARAYAAGGASCLSILTDGPSFMGDESHFVVARNAVTLPCIRKEFLVDTWQVAESRGYGADAILVIMAMVDDALASDLIAAAQHYKMDALVEVHDANEMSRALKLKSNLIGVNNRNLRNFEIDISTTESLSRMVSPDHILVAESGIFTVDDVIRLEATGACAMLVGESLMRQADVTLAAKKLLSLA
ncbi:indole-3-glycerol phosphate synthase TrpC [Asticcacaulis sp. ZE23SCel15]|uniref:indole-3-glycerol phosphate synthase TrpC n=1 Tax=Asticcacaulis sp. ZE23SCel15 TaxID=3059027 RepID=UPI00265E12EE|nr:indole-3-glycerol phosphate synthase TrpC [Asticcacaulis sp. ZE23SCel15]WKL56576.1 indole-3-glycerol phosphate synthase TrpC [Asticcacaulis sp. ZE23SCel15]